MSARRLTDADLAAALDSLDAEIAAAARAVTHAGVRAADLESSRRCGTLDRAEALRMRDDLHAAQAAHEFYRTHLLALIVAKEGT